MPAKEKFLPSFPRKFCEKKKQNKKKNISTNKVVVLTVVNPNVPLILVRTRENAFTHARLGPMLRQFFME